MNSSKGTTGLTGLTGTMGVGRLTAGWGGHYGVAGSTGMSGLGIYACDICGSLAIYKTVTIDFDETIIDYKLTIHSKEIIKKYQLCATCYENTRLELLRIAEEPIEDMPLYICSKNIFVKELASKRLEGVREEL